MSLSRVILSRTAALLPMGLQSRIKWTLMIPDQLASLRHMRDAGFHPNSIVDVGAYVGKFARMAKDVWPDAAVIMFEPQPDKQAGLQEIAQNYRDLQLTNALLGARSGDKVPFHLHESASSMKHFRSDPGVKTIELTTTTLDEAVAGSRFERPELVKIDVQGAELDVMAGGRKTIEAAQAVILELSLVEEYQGSPLFHEMIAHMAGLGFRVYDICTIWRNNRKSMIEADVIFARPTCPAFDTRNYWDGNDANAAAAAR